PIAWANAVSPGYFKTMGIPLLRGRDVTAGDTAASSHVAVVNEAFAREILGGTPVLGVRVLLPPLAVRTTIVGVVANTRRNLTDPRSPEFYTPAEQSPQPIVGAVVYAPHVLPATIEREINDAFALTMPLTQPPATYTMSDRIANATAA